MTRTTTAIFAATAILAAACGASDADVSVAPDADPVAVICLEDEPDCVDADLGEGLGGADDDAAIDEGAMIRDAEGLLGEVEEDVLEQRPDVRVGRRGDEHLMLTEDYVVGRLTIATEEDDAGVRRVVEVTLELTDGPQVFASS